MVYFLRHIALRLWFTGLIGGLFSLWILPSFQSQIGLEWALLPVAGVLALVFMGIDRSANRLGLNAIERLLREAGAWERDGMYSAAEKAFRQAVGVCDSFLISPPVRRKTAARVGARLARFYLAHTDRNPASEAFLRAYLQSYPEDEEVAENWLVQVENAPGLKEEHQGLVYRIGGLHPRNQNIQGVLARFYLLLERTDFPALQTYRRVLNGSGAASGELVKELALLLVRNR
ncbi:MAG: hypothetical protein JSW39_15765, partial [Desulfobacterales bacterium]